MYSTSLERFRAVKDAKIYIGRYEVEQLSLTGLDRIPGDKLTPVRVDKEGIVHRDYSTYAKAQNFIARSNKLVTSVTNLVSGLESMGDRTIVLCNRLSFIDNLSTSLYVHNVCHDVLTGRSTMDERNVFFQKDRKVILSSRQVALGLFVGSSAFFDNVIIPYPMHSEEYIHMILSRTKKRLIFLLPTNSSIGKASLRKIKRVVKNYCVHNVFVVKQDIVLGE